MTKNTDNITRLNTKADQRYYLAYTLNNEQPVKCTAIGDQPLFYMDYEDIDDEHDIDDMLDIDMIEQGLEEINQRINDLNDRAAGQIDQTEGNMALIADFMENGNSLTSGIAASAKILDISAVAKTLSQSRTGEAFLRFASEYNCEIKLSTDITGANYDRESGHIYVESTLADDQAILLISRELRRQWNHRNGTLLNPLSFHPENSILVNRAILADQQITMIKIAWELQLAGERAAWDAIENSSMNDLARAFAREAFIDFRALNDGTACSSVFEAWFLSERCRFEDRKLIQQMLADHAGIVFEDTALSQNITSEFIFKLGEMPVGKNYLAPYGQMILEDALFTEVRDRSNANFLWFVKFERSFREAEQELQTSNQVTHRDILDNNKENWIGENETTADIIAPDFGRAPDVAEKQQACGKQNGSVVVFKPRSTE